MAFPMPSEGSKPKSKRLRRARTPTTYCKRMCPTPAVRRSLSSLSWLQEEPCSNPKPISWARGTRCPPSDGTCAEPPKNRESPRRQERPTPPTPPFNDLPPADVVPKHALSEALVSLRLFWGSKVLWRAPEDMRDSREFGSSNPQL